MGSSAAVVEALHKAKCVRGVAKNVHAQCRVKRRASPVPFRSNVFPGFIIQRLYTELVPVVRVLPKTLTRSARRRSRLPEEKNIQPTRTFAQLRRARPRLITAYPGRTGVDGREQAGPGDESHARYFCHLAAR